MKGKDRQGKEVWTSAPISRRQRHGSGPPDPSIKSEIMSRLLLAHSIDAPEPLPDAGPFNAEAVALFAPLTVQLGAHELLAQVELFLRRGVSVEQLLVELLAPAARWLGEEWQRDQLDFVEVTMGLWRLQEVLREVGLLSPALLRQPGDPQEALFAPMPGDQHTFGTAVVDECFTRAGWRTELMIEPSRRDLINRIASKPFDLLGLTVSNDSHIALLPALVSTVRSVSRNPHLCVLLGGHILNRRRELAMEIGADGTAPDAVAAVGLASRLVSSRARAALG
jgi:MerR family transcriptional regulator, light-induced transcriptional regulator